jgi:hypothetical protein
VARIARQRALLFCAVDDHLHVVLACPREEAGRIGGHLPLAMQWGGREMQPAYVRPVADRRHLQTLVGYVLRQPAAHGLGTHPARWEGSCLWDLLGARVLPGFDSQALHGALPRLDLREILDPAGLSRAPVPLEDPGVRQMPAPDLVHAVAAAAGLAALAADHRKIRFEARTVCAHLSHRAGIRDEAIGDLLGVVPRAARRLRARPVDPALMRATRTWLDLDRMLRARNGSELREGPQARRRSMAGEQPE